MRRHSVSRKLSRRSDPVPTTEFPAEALRDEMADGPRKSYDYRDLIDLPGPQQWRSERRKFPRVEIAGTLVFGSSNLPVEDISSTGMKLAKGCANKAMHSSPFVAELYFLAYNTLYRQKLVVEFVDLQSPMPRRLHTRMIIDGAQACGAEL